MVAINKNYFMVYTWKSEKKEFSWSFCPGKQEQNACESWVMLVTNLHLHCTTNSKKTHHKFSCPKNIRLNATAFFAHKA